MFVVSFQQVSGASTKFKPNKWGEMPFIGSIKSGIALASVIDAAVFEGNNLKANVLYLAENGVREYKGKNYPTVDIITPVTAIEFITFRRELGAGRLAVAKAIDTVSDDELDNTEVNVNTDPAVTEAAKVALASADFAD